MDSTQRIDVNAYLDRELGPEEAAEIETRLAADPEERARFDALARQKNLVGAALSELEAVAPPNLQTARLQRQLADALHRRPARRWGSRMRGGAQVAAACALVAFGWWGHAAWSPVPPSVPGYVSEAVGAHRVFAEDLVRPAEFTGGDVLHAAEWFSSKIGVPVAPPDLEGQDLALVGARLLGTREGPLAQFIYEDRGGERYSLTLARHPDNGPLAPVQVVDYPDRAVGYWSTPSIDFALIGRTDRDSVRSLATMLAERI